MPAFERAMEHPGVDGIECDLRLTADDVVVIHHDAELSDGRSIAGLLWKDIPCYVPTLRDLLRRASSRCYQGLLNLEIKTYDTIAAVIAIIHQFPVIRPLQILLTSFLHTEVDKLRDAGFARGIILSCQPHCSYIKLIHNTDKLVLRHSTINWNDQHTAEELELCPADIFLWTVNNPVKIREMRQRGFNIVTDVLPST